MKQLTSSELAEIKSLLAHVGLNVTKPRNRGKIQWTAYGTISGQSFADHMAMLRDMSFEDQISRLRGMTFKTGSIKSQMIRTLQDAIIRRDKCAKSL